MTSLEDVARSIGERSAQNGFTAAWAWSGDDLHVQLTTHKGGAGPILTLSRDRRMQTVVALAGKRFGPWLGTSETFAWGRFWRAVHVAAATRTAKRQEQDFGHKR